MSKLVNLYCEDIVSRYPLSATHNTTIIPFVDSIKKILINIAVYFTNINCSPLRTTLFESIRFLNNIEC